MYTDFITVLGLFLSGVGFFLSLFFLIRNRLKDDGYLFMYFMLLLLAYELFYNTLIHSQLIYSFIGLYVPGRSYHLLLYPVFLFFVFTITQPKFRLKPYHWLVLLLIIGLTLWKNLKSIFLTIIKKRIILDRFYADTRPGSYNYWFNWEAFLQSTLIPLLFLSFIGYEFWTFKNRNQNQKKQLLLNILLTIIVLFFLYKQFSNILYQWLYQLSGWSLIEWPTDILFTALIISLLSVITLSVNSGATFLPPSKYTTSALAPSHYFSLINKAKHVIEAEQLFKTSDFSLQHLASKIDTNPNYLSQAINHHLEVSFNDFINQFRIEEAKKQLVNPENDHLTIEAIAQLCGFRSKSTFFRVFKKVTGMTPKQYVITQNQS